MAAGKSTPPYQNMCDKSNFDDEKIAGVTTTAGLSTFIFMMHKILPYPITK